MTKVFEAEATVQEWDEAYYHPIALTLYDNAIRDMLRMMRVEPGATVLDAGCGQGAHSIRVASAGHRVCAIDISETMLAHARQRVAARNLSDRVTFSRQDLTNLDSPDNSFRYAFSWGVVIHIPDAHKALNELARIIEPGGKLALYVTNRTALDHKIESVARWLAGKPLNDMQHLELGDGIWYDLNNEKLWVWRIDAEGIAAVLKARGLELMHRRVVEFSEIQRRLRGSLRNLLLRFNNLTYRLNPPVRLAVGQLLIFEKRSSQGQTRLKL